MWNRVILLTCGMAIGWGLANYWTCAPDDMPRHRYRITLGVIVAFALSLWIAWDDPASGIIALSFLALSALVTFAGRARQISSLVNRTTPLPVADASPAGDARAIVLVSHALPEAYTGPERWVRSLWRSPGVSEPDRSWFSRPRVLQRIRAGYQRLDSPPDSFLALAAVQERLQSQLGPDIRFAQAHPYAAPRLDSQLVALARQGIAAIMVVPMDLDDAAAAEIEQQISGSHVQEWGVQIVLLANSCLDIWDEQRELEQVDALSRGLPLPDTVDPPLDVLDELADAIGQHLSVLSSP